MRLIIAGGRTMPRHIAMPFIEAHCARGVTTELVVRNYTTPQDPKDPT